MRTAAPTPSAAAGTRKPRSPVRVSPLSALVLPTASVVLASSSVAPKETGFPSPRAPGSDVDGDASGAASGDVDVDVIAPSDALMPGLLPPAAAAAVRNGLEGLGVRFHLETVVEHIANSGEGVRLTLANGEELDSDLVISAVGLRPRTELAAAAGLETQRGIVVNRALETSMPDVYALGDCAEVDGHVLLYVLPLMACARALAKTLVSERTQVKYGTMPVMVKTPCCPTAVCPPPANASGNWEVDADGQDVRARSRVSLARFWALR